MMITTATASATETARSRCRGVSYSSRRRRIWRGPRVPRTQQKEKHPERLLSSVGAATSSSIRCASSSSQREQQSSISEQQKQRMMGVVVVAEKEVEEGAEEEEDEAVKKKKSKKDDENNSSSSDENLVLLATATIAGGIVALNGGPEESLEKIQGFMLSFWNGLIGNHAPGVGGYIEDVYLATLFFGTAYALWRSSAVPRPIGNPIQRKSRTLASTLHVFSGAGALAVALYAVVVERVFRESPGWTWMWVTSSLFLVNSLSYGPLMNIFKASKEGKYAMQLGYSFVASFQGVVWIAWSAQPDAPDWMFWAVMPFWYFSIAKLWESTEFCLALVPEVPRDVKEEDMSFGNKLNKFITAGSRKRLGKMSPDAATLTYVGLNAAAAVFDNCYMAVYTYLGPEQFWHTSQLFNDSDFHLRLVKGTTGSLTVALLIFISTLGWRKQMPMKYAIWLNVALGSVGPWIVLFWHKLLDPSEMWFPQFVFDPEFAYHAYIPSLFGQ
ncbi:unnamed protein product [Bathycoccus prasinos]|mmetsp:Transcript_4719/g.15264  ORF Transcript_4719/g.15264 Transcript_4719/m.15264 type:complete len:498 (+) Transcript_4719:26-1519(+)